ncbi:MAG: OmpH family outer membrane protein [Cyclobacteriaceae bacterium]
MKNLSLILSTVLLVAVGVLYYLHFSAGPKSTGSANVPVGDLTIAYINSDSVLKYYDFLKDNKVVLEAKTKKMDTDYRNRAQGLQSEITAYQRNVSNLTIGQARALEEDLAKKQQNLQMYQQSLSQELMNDESKLNKELYDRITIFLKKYGKDNGLQVVLKYDPSSDVLYGVETLDITDVVVKGLNEEYKTEKSGGSVKADSTTKK